MRSWLPRRRGRRPGSAPADPPAPQDGAPSLLTPAQFASMDRFALEALCRAQAQAVYLGDHLAICRLLGRYKLYLDTRDRGFAGHVLLDGYWEMWLTIFMCRHVQRDMVVIDVGANFGYYTVLLADLVGPGGHVYAIEPHPLVAALLRRSVVLNGFAGWTSVIEAAAAAAPGGSGLLYSPQGEYKNTCLIASPDNLAPDDGALHKVDLTSVDHLLSTTPRLNFVKIDAEGAEESIIEGMQRSLNDQKPSLVLEFNARRYQRPETLLRRLTSIYKVISYLDFYGRPILTTEEALISERVGEDWLLFFDHDLAIS